MPFLTLLSCPPIDLFVKLVYCCFSTTIFPNCFLWTSLIQLETLSRIDRMCQIANHGQRQYLVKFCHRKYHIFNAYIFYYMDTSIKFLYKYGDILIFWVIMKYIRYKILSHIDSNLKSWNVIVFGSKIHMLNPRLCKTTFTKCTDKSTCEQLWLI